MDKKKNGLSSMLLIFRLVIGAVFIFSSVVKGIDPLGTAYRVEDYLEVYGWYFLVDFSLALAILLIIVEFALGVSMLLRLRFRLGALGVLLIMIIFTVVTYYDATLNLVPDCGCFGDAVKLSNWETFYKNIVLIVMALVVFAMRKKAAQKTPVWLQTSLLTIISLGFGVFVYYNIAHLPAMDFRIWKVGNDMKTVGEGDAKVYVSYKNTQSGEVKEYLSPNYPWNDSTWKAQWEFVGQRFDNSSVIKKHELIIEDSLGNDFTRDLIENPGVQVFIVSPDLEKADPEGMTKALQMANDFSGNISFAVLTGSDFDFAGKYFSVRSADVEVYFADDIELKVMVRSNPGIVILNNGVVVNKYHYNDFDEIKEFDTK